MKHGQDLRAAAQEEQGGGRGGEHVGMLGPSRRRWILQKTRVRLPGNTKTRRSCCAIWPKALGVPSTSSVKSLTRRATPGKRVRMRAKWEGVERQRCSVTTRKPLGTGHLARKPSTPGGIAGKNTYPGGKSRKRGGFFPPKKIRRPRG